MSNIKNFNKYLFEGRREQKKIDELLDISTTRRLTDVEKDLLRRLSSGEKLPKEEDITDQDGGEFFTDKGKKIGADKLEKNIDHGGAIARVYCYKNSPERFILYYSTNTNVWYIYRTGNPDKMPLGVFLSRESQLYKDSYNDKKPEQVWLDCDQRYDYGMILDQDLLKLFEELLDLSKRPETNRNKIIKIRQRFLSLF